MPRFSFADYADRYLGNYSVKDSIFAKELLCNRREIRFPLVYLIFRFMIIKLLFTDGDQWIKYSFKIHIADCEFLYIEKLKI